MSTLADEACVRSLLAWFRDRKTELKAKSRTGSLWMSYIAYIFVILDFIRSERSSDLLLHLSVTKRVLNLFAATGHNIYAKSCRLYYRSALNLEEEFPLIYEEFMKGNHTVRRTAKNWAGLSTDLGIEQILMKSLKGRGGVIGKGLSENVTRTWTKTMHRCAEISEAVETLIGKTFSDCHQETLPGRVERDSCDLEKVTEFFVDHNPFEVVGQMVCLTSGLIDDNKSVNCDESESVGSSIHAKMEGKSYSGVSFKRKDKITNLQSLYSVSGVAS